MRILSTRVSSSIEMHPMIQSVRKFRASNCIFSYCDVALNFHRLFCLKQKLNFFPKKNKIMYNVHWLGRGSKQQKRDIKLNSIDWLLAALLPNSLHKHSEFFFQLFWIQWIETIEGWVTNRSMNNIFMCIHTVGGEKSSSSSGDIWRLSSTINAFSFESDSYWTVTLAHIHQSERVVGEPKKKLKMWKKEEKKFPIILLIYLTREFSSSFRLLKWRCVIEFCTVLCCCVASLLGSPLKPRSDCLGQIWF